MEGNTNTQTCICLHGASSITWSGLGKNLGLHGEIKAARSTGFVFVSVQNPRKSIRIGLVVTTWWGNRRDRDHWGDLVVNGLIILGWTSRSWDVGI